MGRKFLSDIFTLMVMTILIIAVELKHNYLTIVEPFFLSSIPILENFQKKNLYWFIYLMFFKIFNFTFLSN